MKPNHIGIILDGNRRWASARGLKVMQGHLESYQKFSALARHCFVDQQIPYLTAFVFSTENWKRTEEEVSFLMNLVIRALSDYLDEFIEMNVRIVILGSRDKLSKKLIQVIEEAEAKTAANTGGTLSLCFNYGGQQEIVDAARSLVESGIAADGINEQTFAQHLYHPEVPPIDLVIRSSGEQRLSGFMLWRSSYAEMLFVDKHWPDFTNQDLDAAIAEYGNRHRRYGK